MQIDQIHSPCQLNTYSMSNSRQNPRRIECRTSCKIHEKPCRILCGIYTEFLRKKCGVWDLRQTPCRVRADFMQIPWRILCRIHAELHAVSMQNTINNPMQNLCGSFEWFLRSLHSPCRIQCRIHVLNRAECFAESRWKLWGIIAKSLGTWDSMQITCRVRTYSMKNMQSCMQNSCRIQCRMLCGIYANLCGIISLRNPSATWESKQISCRVRADPMQIPCQSHAEIMPNSTQNPCRIECRIPCRILCRIFAKSMRNLSFHADSMQSPCRFQRDLCWIPCRIHAENHTQCYA